VENSTASTTKPQFNQQVLRIVKTGDGKRVLLHVTFLGFYEDLKQFIAGERAVFRMKQIPKRFRNILPIGDGVFNPTVVKMRRTSTGKYVVITVSYVGFTQDLQEFVDGKRNSFRLKLLPPYDPAKVKKTTKSEQQS